MCRPGAAEPRYDCHGGHIPSPTTSAYRGPVMIIRGGADGFVTEQLVDTISPRFVQPEAKVIDKGGHWVHAEYPGTVATMVLDFVDGIVP